MGINQATVFIVDDDRQLRNSLDLLFRSEGLQTKSYETAVEFLEQYDPEQPGCLILDLCLDGMSGLELQLEMSKRKIRIPHILISGYAEVPKVVKALKAGAVDFLEKPCRYEQLLQSAQLAIEQDASNRLQSAERLEIQERFNSLSPREREVMSLLVVGKRTKEIAAQLDISSKTVDIHRANVLKKSEATNVVELLQMLHRLD
jgi:two-component system response regulator FixJ